jgi:hypothetical protein
MTTIRSRRTSIEPAPDVTEQTAMLAALHAYATLTDSDFPEDEGLS